jgi:hypothetical protein
VTDQSTTLDVTPGWYEPIKPPAADQIRLPADYDKNSPTDVRKFQCLSTYRSMINKGQMIDFIAQPFYPAVENTETLIVVLNELAHELGARLTFTDATFQYNDSDYRMACGVGNLGSIHSMIALGQSAKTAKFKLHLKINYDTVTASAAAIGKFTVNLICDIAAIVRCNKEFIRVFSISRASSIDVQVGITTTEFEQTKLLAEQLMKELNRSSTQQRQNILQYLIKEPYDYQWGPTLGFCNYSNLILILDTIELTLKPRKKREVDDRIISPKDGIDMRLKWMINTLKIRHGWV